MVHKRATVNTKGYVFNSHLGIEFDSVENGQSVLTLAWSKKKLNNNVAKIIQMKKKLDTNKKDN